MAKYYQELTLIDHAEISPYFIWSKLYNQLHLALAEIKNNENQINIGVSFPQYVYQIDDDKKMVINLGKKLRIFANQEAQLDTLNLKAKLDRLADYVHITSVRPVPENSITGYASFHRKHVKNNAERLARRRVNKVGDLTFEEAVQRYQQGVKTSNLPYIQFKSLSNGHSFRLFIEKKQGEKSDNAKFNSYGLSLNADRQNLISTVPEF